MCHHLAEIALKSKIIEQNEFWFNSNQNNMKAGLAYEPVILKQGTPVSLPQLLISDKVERSYSNLCFQVQSVKYQ